MTAIRYRIQPAKPEAHLFQVSCEVGAPDPAGQRFRLPAWIPGSYMIREFARHIVTIRAETNGRPVPLEKLDKHTWRAPALAGHQPLTVHYEVYAWDLSVRAAHLDTTHGFFNGPSVFLAVVGQESLPCLVDIQPPAGKAYRNWKVATALAEARGEAGAAKRHGFGLYQAGDYDELIDHPVEMGAFTLARFEAGGVPHEVVLTGRHDCDLTRLTTDLRKICQWQIDLFGGSPPMERYLFLVMVVGEGYGGLEHRASTALLANRNDLPHPAMEGLPEGYKSFLGLCSHEYFHTWNVKRIKPAAFVPYDLAQESYTRLLWAFEGFTSYYDDLTLVRSGVIAPADYLELLGKTLSNVERGSGRLKQSVAESSFDAWIKYYRQDENAPNAIVSYYAKGALVALALDLQLRLNSRGKTSLDDFMVQLWRRHGQTGQGVAEDGLFRLAEELGSRELGRWLRQTVTGTQDIPLERWFRQLGVTPSRDGEAKGPWLGIKLAPGNGEAKLAQVLDDGPAQAAGLAAGDTLVAMDGLRVTSANLDPRLARQKPGDTLTVHAFRRDELMEFRLALAPQPKTRVILKLAPKPSPVARKLRRAWLGA
ncbi:MAG: PDZ domain-containing protein [Rhodocyclaceae bacterium]|jgi:predicted metalloprotease with PDZ domain|nr:PDZ domain-containing protein [Rhodocyclaceae bacterium]